MKDSELGKVYDNGEIIFREGEAGDRMYVVQSGKVKITKRSPSGDLTIAVLKNGEIFGEMALFDRLPRSATAEAFGEARVLGIDKEKLFRTISTDPTLAFRILESMSQRLRKLGEDFMKLQKRGLSICIDVDEICMYVLDEARNIIPADNGSIMLCGERQRTLVIKAAFGAEWQPKMKLGAGEGIAGDVLKTGKAELVNNVFMDSRFTAGSAEIKSMLCVPLKWKSSVFGVINMSNSSEKLFTLDELKMLRSLAIYASIAIENARSCANLKSAADEILTHASMFSKW
ncbi:MAG: cyclic nucleotide-binding domain-containing protein [Nitrospirota bacterium]